MGKILEFDEKARRAMERGVNILADTVKVTSDYARLLWGGSAASSVIARFASRRC